MVFHRNSLGIPIIPSMAAETINANAELVAVIFGVTGLVGKELAKTLLSTAGWKVYGVARRPDNVSPIADPNFHFISCDLLDRRSAHSSLAPVRHVTHLFWITWAAQLRFDSRDCSDQNRAMLANVLDALLPAAPALRHVSLQTGVKHYVSLTDAAGGGGGEVLYCEDSPRAESGNNFYYALEDLLRERLSGDGRRRVAWSVLRPGLILGCSNRTFFNFMGSLCVYGAICKKLKMPFVFGGTAACWEEAYIDGADARLAAEQHIWAATKAVEINATVDGEAFNVCNGWSFTWKAIWGAVSEKLGVTAAEDMTMFLPEFEYTAAMEDKGKVWAEIVEEEGLVPTKMEELANWRFLDSLFRLPAKMVASREKSDRFGFTVKYKMLDSILYWIDVMRHDKLIPFL